jgi:hypothetical protein
VTKKLGGRLAKLSNSVESSKGEERFPERLRLASATVIELGEWNSICYTSHCEPMRTRGDADAKCLYRDRPID